MAEDHNDNKDKDAFIAYFTPFFFPRVFRKGEIHPNYSSCSLCAISMHCKEGKPCPRDGSRALER